MTSMADLFVGVAEPEVCDGDERVVTPLLVEVDVAGAGQQRGQARQLAVQRRVVTERRARCNTQHHTFAQVRVTSICMYAYL